MTVNITQVTVVTGIVAGLGLGLGACGSAHKVIVREVTHTVTAKLKAPAISPSPKSVVKAAHATSVAPAALPELHAGTYTGREPATIRFSGDAGNIAVGLVWSSWTSTEAAGSGTVNIQGCNPDCASGSETPEPVTITLSQPANGQFAAITENISGEGAQDFTASGVWPLGGAGQTSENPAAAPVNSSYVQDILNVGIVAPASWITSTGNTLCADWANGEPAPGGTDNILLAGGILPIHTAIYDSITAQDLCPTAHTPAGP